MTMTDHPPPGLPEGWSYDPTPASGSADDSRPTSRNRNRTWIAATIALLAVAITCILVFVVFHDNIFDGAATIATSSETTASTTMSTGAGGVTPATTATPGAVPAAPEQVVRTFFTAVENEDPDALLALLDPAAADTIFAGEAADEMKDVFFAKMFDYGSVEFSDVVLSTRMIGETAATVTVVSGTVSMTSADGAKNTRDISDAGSPVELEVNLRDGEWYLNPLSMLGSVF
ncbi:MAG: hypothetical protein JW990_16235 [Thermoleophilia bacterium]|nr:hypothetical protein [Thermoleophilia bacterium]